jgi:hypothetical protein
VSLLLQLGLAQDTETFKKLKANAKQVDLNGKKVYFVEGDIGVDEDELRKAANRLDAEFQLFKAGGSSDSSIGSPIMMHTKDGVIQRWQPGSTLTYCVLKQTLGSNYDAVVANMKAATAEWESHCNIKFKYDVTKDNSAPAVDPPAGITFTVRMGSGPNSPIASAFFPGDEQDLNGDGDFKDTGERSKFHLRVFSDYFTTTFDKVGVLRHELGHVLGFRHEHIRSSAPAVCQGEALFGAIPATAYDPQSVMHYFCGGAGSPQLAITALDRQGAQMVYGAPTGATIGSPAAALGGMAHYSEYPLDVQFPSLSVRIKNNVVSAE